jgi:hypothetical protein
MEAELKLVTVYTNEPEALMAKERLEQAGLEAFVASDDAGGMHPHLQLTRGVKLLVREEDMTLAREILGLEEE